MDKEPYDISMVLFRIKNINKRTKKIVTIHRRKYCYLFSGECWEVLKLEHVTDTEIRKRMEVEGQIIDTTKHKQLSWYVHLRRMNSKRWPKTPWDRVPPERKKSGKPRRMWIDSVNHAMQIRQLPDYGWEDRKTWMLQRNRPII